MKTVSKCHSLLPETEQRSLKSLAGDEDGAVLTVTIEILKQYHFKSSYHVQAGGKG